MWHICRHVTSGDARDLVPVQAMPGQASRLILRRSRSMRTAPGVAKSARSNMLVSVWPAVCRCNARGSGRRPAPDRPRHPASCGARPRRRWRRPPGLSTCAPSTTTAFSRSRPAPGHSRASHPHPPAGRTCGCRQSSRTKLPLRHVQRSSTAGRSRCRRSRCRIRSQRPGTELSTAVASPCVHRRPAAEPRGRARARQTLQARAA